MKIQELINNLNFNIVAKKTNSIELINKFKFKFDEFFIDFVDNYENVEGMSNERFIMFWSVNEILELNPYYEEEDICKYLIFFATNGNNLGYAFDIRKNTIVSIDFLEISIVEPQILAYDFEVFFNNLFIKE